MKTEHEYAPYGRGRAKMLLFNRKYDYMLFRQDLMMVERVYFMKKEIPLVVRKIDCGKILIHPNYSILVAKNKTLLKVISLSCYGVVAKGFKNA